MTHRDKIGGDKTVDWQPVKWTPTENTLWHRYNIEFLTLQHVVQYKMPVLTYLGSYIFVYIVWHGYMYIGVCVGCFSAWICTYELLCFYPLVLVRAWSLPPVKFFFFCKDAKMQRCNDEIDSKMLRCKDAKIQRCKDAKMQKCKDAKMQRCNDEIDSKMQRCKDAKIQRCKDAKMQKCKDAKMQRCNTA